MGNEEWTKVEGGEVFSFEKEGDAITGKLANIRPGQYNNENYDIETEEGLRVVFGGTVLNGRITKNHIGKQIKIEYLGKKTSKKGRQYDDFNIFTKEAKNVGGDTETNIGEAA